jgi:hypothetical protein
MFASICASNCVRSVLGRWLSISEPATEADRRAFARVFHDKLLAILPDRGAESGGWDRAWWFYWPCRMLDGAKPADVWVSAPKRVIDAAVDEFQQPKDGDW